MFDFVCATKLSTSKAESGTSIGSCRGGLCKKLASWLDGLVPELKRADGGLVRPKHWNCSVQFRPRSRRVLQYCAVALPGELRQAGSRTWRPGLEERPLLGTANKAQVLERLALPPQNLK